MDTTTSSHGDVNASAGYTVDEAQHAMAVRLIPVMVYAVVLCVTGFVGNLIVLFVYGFRFKKSATTNYFILALSLFDLLTCTIGIPFDIVEMRHSYTFDMPVLCKGFRFVVYFSTLSSVGILILISVDRFRKICHPVKRQMTRRMAKISCFLFTALACFLSTPLLLFYGTKISYLKGTNIVVEDCSISSSFENTIYPLIHNGLLVVAFVLSVILMSTLYLLIGRQISRHRRFKAPSFVTPSQKSFTNIEIAESFAEKNHNVILKSIEKKELPCKGVELTSSSDHGGSSSEEHTLPTTNTNSTTELNVYLTTKSKDRNAKRSMRAAVRTTVMLFCITVLFFLSFLPHLLLMVWTTLMPGVIDSFSAEEDVVFNIFLRSYFINCAANPFIYASFNKRFRTEVLRLFVKHKPFSGKDQAASAGNKYG